MVNLMTTKQTQRVLGIAAGVAVLAALGVLAWGVFVPARVVVPDGDRRGALRSSPSDAADASGQAPSLAQLQQLGSIDLRRPLRDPPPIVVTPPPLTARLTGTVYDPTHPDQSMAIFKLADNTERWFKPGQQFPDPAGEVTLDAIADQKATVTYRGQKRELSVNTP